MPLLLPAGNASTWTGPTGNNTWLLTGRIPTLIDAGVGKPEHLEALDRALSGRALALVLITHGHVDHASGVPRLFERWPGVRVRQLGTGDDPLRDDERVHAGDGSVRVLATPGHAADHCCFHDQESGDLFCGDLARSGGTIVIPARRGGDLTAYLESLRRVRALEPARLLPGHGPVIENPAELIDSYLRHREQRDRQVLAALSRGERTAEEIAASIYRGLPEALQAAAAETVLAHLLKLQREGRVEPRGEAWVQAG
ncbi:MAG TPA: MBL fold metallo-hydrolase [Vicinamibacterales bacterium]|nr:MBL fold metallo-hydrolase [Vicinamibacterales bacterium]